jgi:hypothetical protein
MLALLFEKRNRRIEREIELADPENRKIERVSDTDLFARMGVKPRQIVGQA